MYKAHDVCLHGLPLKSLRKCSTDAKHRRVTLFLGFDLVILIKHIADFNYKTVKEINWIRATLDDLKPGTQE